MWTVDKGPETSAPWMDTAKALLQLAGSGCHLAYIIYPDYSQDCFQPAADRGKETCADPLLTEPMFIIHAEKTSQEKLLIQL